MRLIIHAPNVHHGGGRGLLLPVLEACAQSDSIFILDERLPAPHRIDAKPAAIHRIRPRLWPRLMAERLLRDLAKSGDIVLCMGNLPPLFPIAAKVFVFVQNRYLVEQRADLSAFSPAVRARIGIERLWLRLRRKNAHAFIVQTDSMREIVASAIGVNPLVMPYLSREQTVARRVRRHDAVRTYNFVYVASGEPHKNHKNLVRAWVLLSHEGLRPHLGLTLDRVAHPALTRWIEQKKIEHRLLVSNLGHLSPVGVCDLYRNASALIFPSTLESFGLPLVEARRAGLPILAAELDYVRDLVDPEESFDPSSARSIARAVKRFIGARQRDTKIMDAAAFVRAINAGDTLACTSSS